MLRRTEGLIVIEPDAKVAVMSHSVRTFYQPWTICSISAETFTFWQNNTPAQRAPDFIPTWWSFISQIPCKEDCWNQHHIVLRKLNCRCCGEKHIAMLRLRCARVTLVRIMASVIQFGHSVLLYKRE